MRYLSLADGKKMANGCFFLGRKGPEEAFPDFLENRIGLSDFNYSLQFYLYWNLTDSQGLPCPPKHPSLEKTQGDIRRSAWIQRVTPLTEHNFTTFNNFFGTTPFFQVGPFFTENLKNWHFFWKIIPLGRLLLSEDKTNGIATKKFFKNFKNFLSFCLISKFIRTDGYSNP